MRPALALCCLAFLFANAASAEETTGRVRSIYYESSRGVLVDASMLRRPAAARWADVELVGSGSRVLAQLAAGMDAAVGDLVSVRLGEAKSSQLAQALPSLTVSRAQKLEPGPLRNSISSAVPGRPRTALR